MSKREQSENGKGWLEDVIGSEGRAFDVMEFCGHFEISHFEIKRRFQSAIDRSRTAPRNCPSAAIWNRGSSKPCRHPEISGSIRESVPLSFDPRPRAGSTGEIENTSQTVTNETEIICEMACASEFVDEDVLSVSAIQSISRVISKESMHILPREVDRSKFRLQTIIWNWCSVRGRL
jgi:hypothetical protein